jgi:dienelactone hydrolase
MRILLFLLAALTAFAQSPEERTRQALDLVLARKYQAFYDLFAPEMKKAITLETYSQQADQILNALGTPKSIGAAATRMVQGSPLVTIPIHWASTSLNFLVSWNADGKIQGTFFRPGAQPASPWTPPDYAKADAFIERDVTIGDDRWKLPGTLTLPKGKGPFPAVVLVHGSGPQDRDESVGGVKPFKDLSQGLATRGIAVLRYVKRTKQYPVIESAPTMTAETVEDAVRAADLLRHQPEVDPKRVYVLGHSQGGYMMPRIMQRDGKLAGVILMAGNVRSLDEVVVEQSEYLMSLSSSPSEAQRKKLEELRKDPWSIAPNIPSSYRDDLKGYNPAAEARKIDMPMLVLQGERDYQVTMKDFALWREALGSRANVTFHSYPKLNHLFVAGEGKPNPQEYQNPGHVMPEVVEDIAAWVRR